MTAVDAPRPPVADDDPGWPAELRLLLGPDAGGILGAAVGAAGGELGPWWATQAHHQPDRSTLVQYRAEVRWPGAGTTTGTVVAATGLAIPDGALVLGDGGTRVGVWRWPVDPALPALPAALDQRRVAALLDDIGVGGGSVQLRVRAYRPGRRAVIEATGRRGRLFLKVVRPAVVEQLHSTHRLLARHLPVPDSLGWSADGIVVLPALPGRTLRETLRSARRPVPPPAAVHRLLDRLPAHLLASGRHRRGPLATAAHYADVVAAALPSARGRLDDLLAALAARGDDDEHHEVPVHGDLYESQLLVDGGRITGLLDVDTAGRGCRVDDVANLCAHLSVLALTSDRPRAVKRFGAAVLADGEARHGRSDLRRRTAAAAIGLATGPFRVLEPGWAAATERRLALAGEWLSSAAGTE